MFEGIAMYPLAGSDEGFSDRLDRDINQFVNSDRAAELLGVREDELRGVVLSGLVGAPIYVGGVALWLKSELEGVGMGIGEGR
jgi:hypothetical protein